MGYREEIARQLSKKHHGSTRHHQKILRDSLQIILEILYTDQKIEIRDFGTFKIQKTTPRTIKHPRTGEQITTKTTTIKFKPSKKVIKTIQTI